MPMKLLSADDFRSEAKDGGKPDGTVFRFATGDPQAVDGATRTKRFVFSAATIDHAGDSIDPKGWDLSIFKRNPVSLFAHMSWEPPIGRASNVTVQNDQLVGDIEFAEAEVYEFADTIFRLVDGGFMKAVSAGFKPKEWAFTNDKNRPYGIDFKKQTLLEISICPVPCNPNALGEARSAGIDTRSLVEWAEKVLDNGDTVFLPKKDLEALRGQASGVEAPRYYIHTPKAITAEVAERIRDRVKAWQQDQSEVLILEGDIELRTIGDAPAQAATEADEPIVGDEDGDELSVVVEGILERELTEEESTSLTAAFAKSIAKAGRRLSAATKAKLAEAMGHHDSVGKCIKDVMEDDDEDIDPDGDGDLDLQPPGTIVIESDDHLTPEERRIKEVRALRDTLPTND